MSLESNIFLRMAFSAQKVSEKLIIALSALITRILNEMDYYVSLLNN